MIEKLKIKTFSLAVISFLVVLTALTGTVLAADYEITPSDSYSISSDKTFVLNQDCTLTSGQILVDGITISNVDLNGHKLTSNVQYPITVESDSDFVISHGTIEITKGRNKLYRYLCRRFY